MTRHALVLLLLGSVASPPASGQEETDLATIHRIKAEAFQGSKVMDRVSWDSPLVFELASVLDPKKRRAGTPWPARLAS